jgi:hypothetical protein
MSGGEEVVRFVQVAEDCTVPYDGGSGMRYVVKLRKGDNLQISRKLKTANPNEIARRLDRGEQFFCGATDCPGYSFEPGELSHHDPKHPGLCAADLRENAQRNAGIARTTVAIDLEALSEE